MIFEGRACSLIRPRRYARTRTNQTTSHYATIHPIRKPSKPALTKHDQRFNAGVSSIRAAVERAVSHLKNWKILATRFRPPLEKFAAALRAIVDLYFLKWSCE